MRLINIKTLEFKEFFQQSIPPYVIVSHRWGPEELCYEDIAEQRFDMCKLGFAKLHGAIQASRAYGVDYLWIDTCCIDKKSSAELSEAINSMYMWYQEAKVCMAYIEDSQVDGDFEPSLRSSVWFSRSWTLQELLAPKCVDFFDSGWERRCDKRSASKAIADITGIPRELLEGRSVISEYIIAERMSWASNRTATRIEDKAYSLLGLFDIHMGPLYGEGDRAFYRLQREIIDQSKDATFLYWSLKDPTVTEDRNSRARLLARHPGEYGKVLKNGILLRPDKCILRLTNLSLEIEGILVRWQPHTYAVLLASAGKSQLALLVRKQRTSDAMYRVDVCHEDWYRCAASPRRMRKIVVSREVPEGELNDQISAQFKFTIQIGMGIEVMPLTIEYGAQTSARKGSWTLDHRKGTFQVTFRDLKQPALARLNCAIGTDRELSVDLAFDFNCRPCAQIYRGRRSHFVWETSDAVHCPNPSLGGDQYKLIDFPHPDAESCSLFLRATDNCEMWAELPKEFAPDGTTVLTSFLPPRVMPNESENWAFRIVKRKW